MNWLIIIGGLLIILGLVGFGIAWKMERSPSTMEISHFSPDGDAIVKQPRCPQFYPLPMSWSQDKYLYRNALMNDSLGNWIGLATTAPSAAPFGEEIIIGNIIEEPADTRNPDHYLLDP
jgi:hypothetical protein